MSDKGNETKSEAASDKRLVYAVPVGSFVCPNLMCCCFPEIDDTGSKIKIAVPPSTVGLSDMRLMIFMRAPHGWKRIQ